MKLSTVLLILGGLALVGAAAYFVLSRPPAPAGDNRPWYERGLDSIAPDRLKVGYAGFGVDVAF